MTRKVAAAVAVAVVGMLVLWLTGGGEGGMAPPTRPEAGRLTLPAPIGEATIVEAVVPKEDPAPSGKPLTAPLPQAPEIPLETCVLEGVVLDLLDRPVAGVRVGWGVMPEREERKGSPFRSPMRASPPALFSNTRDTVTGLDGTFRLVGPPQDRVVLQGWIPGGRIEPFGPFRLEGNPKGVVLRVAAAAAVSGEVLRPLPEDALPTASGPPIPAPESGARVVAWRGERIGWDGVELLAETSTDSMGRFQLEGLPPEGCHLEAEAVDGSQAGVRWWPGMEGTVKLLLKDPVSHQADLTGVVFLSDGRTPAAGAVVTVRGAWNRLPLDGVQAVCGADGTFLLRDLQTAGPDRPARLSLRVDAGARGVAMAGTDDWPRSGPVTVVLWPPEFRAILGRAVEADAESTPPIGGLPLRVRTWHEDPGDPQVRFVEERVIRTRADGSFAIERAGTRGPEIEVPLGAAPWEVRQLLLEGDGSLLLEVVPACTLEGTVRTSLGDPVEGVFCTWDGRNGVLSDGNGRFRFYPVPGDRNLIVVARAEGWRWARSLPVTVPRGGAVRDLVVILDTRSFVLTGRVVDGEGAPVSMEPVVLTISGEESGRAETYPIWTDGEGRWRLEPSSGRAGRITATRGGGRTAAVVDVEER